MRKRKERIKEHFFKQMGRGIGTGTKEVGKGIGKGAVATYGFGKKGVEFTAETAVKGAGYSLGVSTMPFRALVVEGGPLHGVSQVITAPLRAFGVPPQVLEENSDLIAVLTIGGIVLFILVFVLIIILLFTGGEDDEFMEEDMYGFPQQFQQFPQTPGLQPTYPSVPTVPVPQVPGNGSQPAFPTLGETGLQPAYPTVPEIPEVPTVTAEAVDFSKELGTDISSTDF